MILNVNLPHIPGRDEKPRNAGITMMMDKGLSLREAENVISASGDFIDLVKFGFGTSLISSELEEKIKLYKESNMKPYFGGTLFEIFLVRGKVDEFCRFIDKNKLDTIEISDGSIKLPHEEKLKYISKLAKNYTVLSEVGSKLATTHISDEEWLNMTKNELKAGAWKVIAEAREAGNVGIYKPDGSANKELISHIIEATAPENILWEAPNKNQQVWFIKLLGANVNLGNIGSNDIIPLETLRLGLRGDTFFQYLPKDIQEKFMQK
jgi:phosphosulfolactate synthase